MEYLSLRHYQSDSQFSIKGWGFDGLNVGPVNPDEHDRLDAEDFICFVNLLIEALELNKVECKNLEELKKHIEDMK